MAFKYIVVCCIVSLICTLPSTYLFPLSQKLEEFVNKDIADIVSNSGHKGKLDSRCSLRLGEAISTRSAPYYMKIHHCLTKTSMLMGEYTISLVSTIKNVTDDTTKNETNSEPQHLEMNTNGRGTGLLSPVVTTRGELACRTNSTTYTEEQNVE